MVEWRQETIQTNGNLQTNSTQMMKITSSSVWVVPEFPPSIVVSAFIVGAFVSVSVILAIVKFKRIRLTIFSNVVTAAN
jgi:hypothetical protein